MINDREHTLPHFSSATISLCNWGYLWWNMRWELTVKRTDAKGTDLHAGVEPQQTQISKSDRLWNWSLRSSRYLMSQILWPRCSCGSVLHRQPHTWPMGAAVFDPAQLGLTCFEGSPESEQENWSAVFLTRKLVHVSTLILISLTNNPIKNKATHPGRIRDRLKSESEGGCFKIYTSQIVVCWLYDIFTLANLSLNIKT